MARKPDPAPGSLNRLLWIVLCFAVLYRLTMLGVIPTLSDDIYRYVWDGKAILNGMNPYHYPPSAEPMAFLRDELYPLINHKDIGTPYTPLTLLAFTPVANQVPPIWIMKLPFVLFDLMTILVLLRLVKEVNLSALAVVAYAWNPLVIFEIAGNGHADSLAVFFMTLALTSLVIKKKKLAAAATAFALLSKYFSVILLPILIRRLGVKEWTLVGILLAIFYAPFLPYLDNHFLALHAVASTWRFNDSLFSLFYWTTGSLSAAKALAGSIFLVVCLVVTRWKKDDLYSAFFLVGAMVLLSPSVQLWYLVWIVPFLCVYPHPAWLYLTASGALSYLLLAESDGTGGFGSGVFIRVAEYGPFFLLLVFRSALGRFFNKG